MRLAIRRLSSRACLPTRAHDGDAGFDLYALEGGTIPAGERAAVPTGIAVELPERHARPSDSADLDALAQALTRCDLVTCDAFMADVIKRARLNLRHQVELFSGRRRDVIRLRDRIQAV